jgi:hypothetical protein
MNINFNDLPSDIKSKIFKINKDDEYKEYYKSKFNNCIDELNMIVESIPFYFDCDEEEIDNNQDIICYFIIGYQLEIKYGCIL